MFYVFNACVLYHNAEFQRLMGREHNYIKSGDDLLAFHVPFFAWLSTINLNQET